MSDLMTEMIMIILLDYERGRIYPDKFTQFIEASIGEEAAWAVIQARKTIANVINAPAKTIHFVSGATEANNIADLPRTCRHGYTVRVVNSGEDMDDYYLRFQAEGIAADIVQTGTYARSSNTVTVTTAATGIAVLLLVDSANTAGERFCVVNPVNGKVIVGASSVATDYEGGV